MSTDAPGRTVGAILKARRAADARLTLHWNGLSREARVAALALWAWSDEHARPILPKDCLRFARFFNARAEVVLAAGGWVHAQARGNRGRVYVNLREPTPSAVGRVDPSDAEVAHALGVFGAAHPILARVEFRRGGEGA